MTSSKVSKKGSNITSVRGFPANTRTRREPDALMNNWQPFVNDVCQTTELVAKAL